jgi:hypothetical protein
MPTQATTDDTTFTSTRKTMHAKTTTRPTTTRPSAIDSVRRNPQHDVQELRASQLVNVATDELEWFFMSTDTESPAMQARAIIDGWLRTLDTAEQRVLALRFDPAPWPAPLQAEGLESGYALVLNLVSTATWRPESRTHHEPHRSAGDRLVAAVRERGISVMRWISRRAEWDFASAVRAYASARGRSPSVIPRCAA